VIKRYLNKPVNESFYLPELWHQDIIKVTKKKAFPYQFKIKETVKDDNGTSLCLCESESKNKGDKIYRLALSEHVVSFLLGSEVPDSNVGFTFKEYFPMERTDLLITEIKKDINITAKQFILFPTLLNIRNEDMPFLDFYLVDDVVDDVKPMKSLSIYINSQKSLWKFLYSKDLSYMSDYEKMFQDTIIHKRYVINSCNKLATYLDSTGCHNHAHQLRIMSLIHDNSKINCKNELNVMSKIINDKECLADANKSLSQIKVDAIKLHWKNNDHHPEHFENYADMSRVNLMEMACDWHARSVQYGTNLIEFVKVRQADRFHFPDWMFAEVLFYCEILTK